MSSYAVVVARGEREAKTLAKSAQAVERVCDTWDGKPVLVLTLAVADGRTLRRLNARTAATAEEARKLAVALHGEL